MKNCVHHVNSYCCINSINVAQIFHFSTRSLIPKLDELKILCVTHEPAVCVVEKLGCLRKFQMLRSPFLITVIRLVRNRHGGGIAIYVRNNIVQVVRVHASLFVQFHLQALRWFIVSSS